MILLEIGNIGGLILMVYLVCHIPAFILLILGLVWRKSHPKRSKILLILAGIYFLVGGGICGAILNG